MVTSSSEIQAIHRKCIRLLIITARFNCRSRRLMLTSPRRCDLVTSHLSPFTADRSLSQPRKSFQSVWLSDSSPLPVSAHLGTREDKRLSEGSQGPEQHCQLSISTTHNQSVLRAPPARNCHQSLLWACFPSQIPHPVCVCTGGALQSTSPREDLPHSGSS